MEPKRKTTNRTTYAERFATRIDDDFRAQYESPLAVMREAAAQQGLMPRAAYDEVPVWVEPSIGDASIGALIFVPPPGIDLPHLIERTRRTMAEYALRRTDTVAAASRLIRLRRTTLTMYRQTWEAHDEDVAAAMGWAE